MERIVVDLASGENGDLRVQKIHELPQNSALGLTPQPEENEVVSGQDRVYDLGDDRVPVPDDPRKQVFTVPKLPQEIQTHLVPHGAGLITGLPELTYRHRLRFCH